MICSQCGHEVSDKALFCPNCGHKLEKSGTENSAEVSQTESQGQGCGRTIIVLSIALLVVLVIVGLGAAGVYYGLQDRDRTERRVAARHYDRALDHLEEGNLELAVAELEHAVALDPGNEEMVNKLEEVRQQLEGVPTATPQLQQETKAAYFEELESAYTQNDWQRALEAADQLLILDSSYRQEEVEQMLFTSLYRRGLELVEQDRLQEAVRLFDRALALQPDDIRVSRARDLATLYTTAMSYWGADWARAIESLSELYTLDPQYKDVEQRLFEAYVKHGDILMEEEAWCQAAEEYAEALEIEDDAQVEEKLEQAMAQCENGPVPTDEMDEEPSAPSGIFVGQFVERQAIDRDSIFIRGKVLDSEGRGVAGEQVRIQAWDWSATATTDGEGQYSFDGLSSPVTYTLSLVDLPSQPVDVMGERGRMAWVNFEETP